MALHTGSRIRKFHNLSYATNAYCRKVKMSCFCKVGMSLLLSRCQCPCPRWGHGRRQIGTNFDERARAATHRGSVEGFGATHDDRVGGACPGYDDASGPASAEGVPG